MDSTKLQTNVQMALMRQRDNFANLAAHFEASYVTTLEERDALKVTVEEQQAKIADLSKQLAEVFNSQFEPAVEDPSVARSFEPTKKG